QMTYTREQIQQLSGRELDRAVSEIVFKCEYETTRKVMDQDGAMYGGITVVIFPIGGPLLHQRRDRHPPFTKDGTLWELFFQEGGVLAPTEERRFTLETELIDRRFVRFGVEE